MRVVVMIATLVFSVSGHGACGQIAPVPGGDVVRDFAPVGRFAGHWGVDLAATPGTQARAALGGTVSFSGTVAGVSSVTINHGNGLRTSYSYLGTRSANQGDRVHAGDVIGETGDDRGVGALHFSYRQKGQYRDPMAVLLCGSRSTVRPYLAP
jgi:murein DD-endopeptidase MepM/ murein hydrolase activator NlpD